MSKHTCMRCGLEVRCPNGSWPDRHPAAAVLFAVPTTLFGLGAIAAYPWLFVPLLVLASVAYIVDREHRRRAALAARADWEYHEFMAAPIPLVRPLPPMWHRPVFPRNRAPSRVVASLPTTPLGVKKTD